VEILFYEKIKNKRYSSAVVRYFSKINFLK